MTPPKIRGAHDLPVSRRPTRASGPGTCAALRLEPLHPVTGILSVRARVAPGPEPPYDRLHDPLVDDLVRGGPLSRERFAVRWSDRAALTRLAETKRRPLSGALCDALAGYHRRLGAPAASLASIERLRAGEAVCAVAGQQPAPLGGPLYSLHKTAAS